MCGTQEKRGDREDAAAAPHVGNVEVPNVERLQRLQRESCRRVPAGAKRAARVEPKYNVVGSCIWNLSRRTRPIRSHDDPTNPRRGEMLTPSVKPFVADDHLEARTPPRIEGIERCFCSNGDFIGSEPSPKEHLAHGNGQIARRTDTRTAIDFLHAGCAEPSEMGDDQVHFGGRHHALHNGVARPYGRFNGRIGCC